MYKSWSIDEDPRQEWDAVLTAEHVAQVTAKLASMFESYFQSWVKPKMPEGEDLLAKLGGKFKVRPSKSPVPSLKADVNILNEAIDDYTKLADRYRDFFAADRIQEYREDDPDAFKTELSRKCPVIQQIVHSKRDELKEWRIKYNRTPSAELLATFEQLISFADEYMAEAGDEEQYSSLSEWEEFVFDGFDEERAGIPGVIGAGIKSIVLYHLHPRVFPVRSSGALYGLYFLTDRSHFSLRSKTSEFLMIDDKRDGVDVNIKMDHNFWYSYRLFASYAMYLANRIETACEAVGLPFDVDFRYVYVASFLEHVCECHADAVKVMRGGDELGFGWAAR